MGVGGSRIKALVTTFRRGGGDPYHMVYGDGLIFITCEMQNNARVILKKCLKTSYNYIIGCINILKKNYFRGGLILTRRFGGGLYDFWHAV